jgi:formate dehydrogenase accessory protein FdhE
MKPAPTGGPDYAARIRRAKHLVTKYPFAAEVLTFYQVIAEFQGNLYGHILRSRNALRPLESTQTWSLPNFAPLFPLFSDVLAMLQRHGPAPVQEAARRLTEQSKDSWKTRLEEFWIAREQSQHRRTEEADDSYETLTEFILRAFVQPYAEFVAAQVPDPSLTANERMCPRCGAAPLLGVLRPEGEGGKRRLLCSFCLQEWDSRRIFCAACAEDDEKKLPVYVAEQFPHIRVEACDTCRFYVRTIDLTKDGNAAPIVDDLAAIPLTLWSQEHGYQRIQPNLLGT